MSSDPSNTERTDQNEVFSLRVKPEFVLSQRAASLPPIVTHAEDDNSNNEQQEDDGGRGGGGKYNNKKKPKNKNSKRGVNRKRPHSKVDQSTKLCLSVIRGTECPFGDACHFTHDLKEFMATRPADITTVEGGCPNFRLWGHCTFGPMCRLGGCHLTKEGVNVTSSAESLPKSPPAPVLNVLDKTLQDQLRKKKYPFQCKLHYEQKKDVKTENDKTVSEKHNSNDSPDTNGPGENASDQKKTKQDSANVNGILSAETSSVQVEKGQEKCDSALAPAMEEAEASVASKNKLETKLAVDENQPFIDTNVRVTASLSTTTPFPDKEVKLVDFSNKIYIAPLTTVGNLPFRRIMKRFGADITCGEMAVATNLLQGQSSEWALLKRHPEEDVFGIQIAAGFPDQATRCCEVLEKHVSMDFVDLNLGCPLDLICDKGCGSALMMRDKRLEQTVRGMTQTLSCPVTLKMRTGWDMSKPFAHKLVAKIQAWDVQDRIAAIMVHGRSRLQRYSNCADWDYIRQVTMTGADAASAHHKPRIPIIGNGDIFSYTDYENKVLIPIRNGEGDGTSDVNLSTCAMLARGVLIKPWLPTEIKERRHWDISATERLDILKDFVRFGLEHWGSDQQGVNNCRRFLLEWLSFLHRYVPLGLLETVPQQMNQRLPNHMCGRNDLETLFLSDNCSDWIKISEMLLGPVEEGFRFTPKHKAKSYQGEG